MDSRQIALNVMIHRDLLLAYLLVVEMLATYWIMRNSIRMVFRIGLAGVIIIVTWFFVHSIYPGGEEEGIGAAAAGVASFAGCAARERTRPVDYLEGLFTKLAGPFRRLLWCAIGGAVAIGLSGLWPGRFQLHSFTDRTHQGVMKIDTLTGRVRLAADGGDYPEFHSLWRPELWWLRE